MCNDLKYKMNYDSHKPFTTDLNNTHTHTHMITPSTIVDSLCIHSMRSFNEDLEIVNSGGVICRTKVCQ